MKKPSLPPPGLVRNAGPADVPGRWWDCNLIRWVDGRLRPVGGHTRITASVFASTIRKLFTYRLDDDRFCVVAGMENALYVNLDSWIDVTPAGNVAFNNDLVGFGVGDYGEEAYGTPRSTPATGSQIAARPNTWSFDLWGQELIAVNSADGRLVTWDPATPTTDAVAVTGAPVSNQWVLTTDQRHVVLLRAGGQARRVGWCSREDINDWDFASTTNTAGFYDLPTTSPLICAIKVREGFLVFSDREVFLFRYIGSPFVYSYDLIGHTLIMNAKFVVAVDGGAMWMGREGFWLYKDGALVQIGCDVGDLLGPDADTGDMDLSETIFAGHAAAVQMLPEVWFWYVPIGDTVPSRYVSYNYKEKWWSRGSLTRTAAWGATADKYWYSANGHVYRQEDGWLADGATRVGSVWIESGAVTPESGEIFDLGSALFTVGSGYDKVQLRAYSRFTPEGTEYAFGPYTIQSDGWCHMRPTGRDIRFRVEGLQDDAWSLGVARFEVIDGQGER